jgi:PAS domain S-box-containing protein
MNAMVEAPPPNSAAKYSAAVSVLAVAVALRWLLGPYLGDTLAFITLFGAVAVAVWLGGYGPAILVAGLGYVACAYLFVSPRGVLGLNEHRNVIGFGAYVLTCFIIIAMGQAMRRAQYRYRQGETIAQRRAETLRITLASVGDAVMTTDVRGNINSLNPVAETLTGWSQGDAFGKPLTMVFKIVNEETGQPVKNPVDLVLKQRRVVGLANHTLLINKSGKEIPIDDSAAPITDDNGEIVGVALVFHDISARRSAEKHQQESQAETLRLLELNRAIVTNMGEGLYTVDTQGLVTFMNPAAERLFGWTSAELLGRKMHDMTHYKHPDGSPFPIEECAGFQVLHEDKVLLDFEDVFIRKDGSFFPVAYCSSQLKSATETVGLVVVFRETSEQKKAEQQLRELAADLSEADRRKNEFLATLAHELRNPLAPIRNGLQVIRLAGGSDPAMEQARVMMERQLRQMIHLVDDLLDVSRISRGMLVLRKERVDLRPVLKDAVETSRPLIDSGNHQLEMDAPDEPVIVEADVTRLVQIFANLLNNAAKYSERGGRIWLTAKRQGDDVLVSVKDAGDGIPPDRLPKLFEMFSQIDRSLERSQSGMGIGLALVKRLVELHGGSVAAFSKGQGLGSEFLVRLPTVSVNQQQQPSSTQNTAQAKADTFRILLADDNEDAAISLAMLLRMMGHEVYITHDGIQAVAVAATLQPEVILLDIGMPKLNGYEVCRQIRQQSHPTNPYIIAVTGWGQDDDKRLAQEAGFDQHFVKPLDPADLEKILARLRAKRSH